ncbi:Eukaryotic translation initiation factor 2-alpha kinase, partial [Stegodyphus mimosarum]
MDGVLTALDLASGEKCWSTLLDTGTFMSSSLSNLEVFEDGNRIWLVPSLDGSLFKYDGAVLQPLPVNVDSLLMHTETLDHNTTVTGGKYKQMYGINRQTGEIHYKCSVNGCESFKKWSADDVLVVEAVVQSVNAVDSVKAEKR